MGKSAGEDKMTWSDEMLEKKKLELLDEFAKEQFTLEKWLDTKAWVLKNSDSTSNADETYLKLLENLSEKAVQKIELARKEGQKNVERDKEDWAKAVLNKDKEINKIDLTKNWEKVQARAWREQVKTAKKVIE